MAYSEGEPLRGVLIELLAYRAEAVGKVFQAKPHRPPLPSSSLFYPSTGETRRRALFSPCLLVVLPRHALLAPAGSAAVWRFKPLRSTTLGVPAFPNLLSSSCLKAGNLQSLSSLQASAACAYTGPFGLDPHWGGQRKGENWDPPAPHCPGGRKPQSGFRESFL